MKEYYAAFLLKVAEQSEDSVKKSMYALGKSSTGHLMYMILGMGRIRVFLGKL